MSECPEAPIKWDYELIASVPEMAETFRTFANRALCQESVCFLEEVTRCDIEYWPIRGPSWHSQNHPRFASAYNPLAHSHTYTRVLLAHSILMPS